MSRFFELWPDAGPPERSRLNRKVFWGLLLLYTVLSVVHLFGGWPGLQSHVIGERLDGPVYLWFNWWGREALFHLHTNPFETQHIYYPLGTSLIITPFSIIQSLLGAPIDVFFGPVAAYNVVMLSTYTLTGVAMYLIVYDLTGSRRAAIIAGTMAVFAPFRLSAATWLNFAVTHWLLFFWWALWRALRRRSVRWGVYTGLFGVLLLYSGYSLFLFAAMSGLIVAVTVCVVARRDVKKFLPAMGAIVAVILVLGAPSFFLLAREVAAHGNYAVLRRGRVDTRIEGKPLSSLVIPAPASVKQGPTVLRAGFLGYVAMLAALTALIVFRRRPIVRYWGVAAGFFLLFSLGDHLNWTGPITYGNDSDAIKLPYHYVKDFPVFNTLRVPHRFGIAGSLCLIVLAGIGLATWEKRATTSLRAGVLNGATALMVGIVMLEFSVPLRAYIPPRTFPVVSVPDIFDEIAADSRDMCVLHEPAGFHGDSMVAFYMIHHGRPLCIEGRSARKSPKIHRSIKRSKLLRNMQRAFGQPRKVPLEGPVIDAVRREAQRVRVGWIVLSRDSLRRNTPKDPDRLDAFVRSVFPHAERLYWREQRETWAARQKHWSAVFAVYRIPW